MSSLFKNNEQTLIQVGSMDLSQLREYHKNMFDEKEVERCPEAAFLNNDKQQTYKVLSSSIRDIVKARTSVKRK